MTGGPPVVPAPHQPPPVPWPQGWHRPKPWSIPVVMPGRRVLEPYAGPAYPDGTGPPALVLPISTRVNTVRMAGCFLFAAIALGLALVAEEGAVTGLAIAALFLYHGVRQLLHGATGPSQLALSAEGVTHTRGRRRLTIPWDRLDHVRAGEKSAGRLPRHHFPQLEFRAREGGHIVVTVDELEVDAAVAYWTAVFYAGQPWARAELGDGRAVARVAHRALFPQPPA